MCDQFTVVELPEIKIVGISVQTDMKKALNDCPALWQTLGPKIDHALSTGVTLSESGDTYGVSKMIDDNNFIYWAGIAVDSINRLPSDMAIMTIPEGLYVKCTAPSLEKLGAVFTAIYTEWPLSQNEYLLDMQGISFERYPAKWQHFDALEVYASVIKEIKGELFND